MCSKATDDHVWVSRSVVCGSSIHMRNGWLKCCDATVACGKVGVHGKGPPLGMCTLRYTFLHTHVHAFPPDDPY